MTMKNEEYKNILKAVLTSQANQIDQSVILEALIQLLIAKNIITTDEIKTQCQTTYDKFASGLEDNIKDALGGINELDDEIDTISKHETLKQSDSISRKPLFKTIRGEA